MTTKTLHPRIQHYVDSLRAQGVSEDKKLHLKACQICGHMELAGLNEEGQEDPIKISDNTPECGHCSYVKTRSPEIYSWVLNVVGIAADRTLAHMVGMMVSPPVPPTKDDQPQS